MKEEHEKQLIERFPKLYVHEKFGNIYFEIEDGWFDLIMNLSLEIEKCVNNSSDKIWPVAAQVKQKFGGLRFYVDNSNRDIDNIIGKYESLSNETCEFCGKPGKRHSSRRWLSTVCDDHKN